MVWRHCAAAAWLCCAALKPADRNFEVTGHVIPPAQASVSLHGATSPFAVSTLAGVDGRFRFTRLDAGQYTLAAFVPGYGEKRLTIDVGPSSVDAKGRFEAVVRLDESAAITTLGDTVSRADLAVPDRARRQYSEAQKRLEKRDIEGAVNRLQKAVDIAPGYTAAWNHLGTIAYQTRRFEDAEGCFRKALAADPAAFEPLVNLGGVLLTRERFDEAYQYNLYAALKRPQDALANSQLGMNYFALGKMELAEKYLLEARRLDPGHFSHPQLLLAEIYLRKNERDKAAEQIEDFLRWHPDWPAAATLRKAAAKWKPE